jgi:PPOX class probable F420-dependent enzyme
MSAGARKEAAMPLDGDAVRLARGANLGAMVTLMPDGQPQVQLRWVDTDGEHLLVNTEPQRQAARNLRRDPRLTVLIRAEDDPWDWAEVRGRVVETIEGEQARAHIDVLSRKYTGADYRNPIGPQGRIILHIAADKVVTPAIRR